MSTPAMPRCTPSPPRGPPLVRIDLTRVESGVSWPPRHWAVDTIVYGERGGRVKRRAANPYLGKVLLMLRPGELKGLDPVDREG
jgi:hypothetical protein